MALNDGAEQAQFVAQRILELRDENVDLNDIAVLYRAHYHAVELQLELSRRGILIKSPVASGSSSRRISRMSPHLFASWRILATKSHSNAWRNCFPALAIAPQKIFGKAGDRSRSLGRERGAENVTIARGRDRATALANALAMNVPAKSRKAWEQLAHTLDEIAPAVSPICHRK